MKTHTVKIDASRRAPGRKVAVCTCGWTSMITTTDGAMRFGEAHLLMQRIEGKP